MRTTIELSEALLRQVRKLASARGTTLRALVEEGLRRVLREADGTRYRLPDLSYGERTNGRPVDLSDWERIRDLTYEGRG